MWEEFLTRLFINSCFKDVGEATGTISVTGKCHSMLFYLKGRDLDSCVAKKNQDNFGGIFRVCLEALM